MNYCRVGMIAFFVAQFSLFLPGVDASTSHKTLILEAESGDLIAPARLVEHPNALGGAFVCLSDPTNPLDDSPYNVERGSLVLRFRVEDSNRYFVWLRVSWHCTCSRELEIDFADSKHPGTENQTSSAIRVTDLSMPRQWHWRRVGHYFYSVGYHSLRINQIGHLANVDRIILSSDASYSPAKSEHDATCFSSDLVRRNDIAESSDWVPIIDRSWSNFTFDAVIGVSNLGSKGDPWTNRLCRVGEDSTESSYDFHLYDESDGWSRLEIIRNGNGKHEDIATARVKIGNGGFHHLRVFSLWETTQVFLDGVKALEMALTPPLEGIVSVPVERAERDEVAEIRICRMKSVVDDFSTDSAAWKPESGIWKVIESPYSDAIGRAYLASSSSSIALSFLSETVGDDFSIETQMRVFDGGTGGIAYGEANSFPRYVVLIENGRESGASLLVFRQTGSGDELIHSIRLENRVTQWSRLKISKYQGEVSISVDLEEVFRFSHRNPPGNIELGLAALEGTVAFGSVRVSEYLDPSHFNYVFEPETNHSSFSHWSEKEGVFSLWHHAPAAIICEADPLTGRFELELKRSIEGDFYIDVEYNANSNKGPEKTPLEGGLWLRQVGGPSCFGVELREDSGSEIAVKVLFEVDRLNTVTVMRGDEILFSRSIGMEVTAESKSIRVERVKNILRLSRIGDSAEDIMEVVVPQTSDRNRVVLIGENIYEEGATIAISKISIDQISAYY